MLSRSIALSEQLASVSLEAEVVFYRLIPHADREGRLPGSVTKLRGLIAPIKDGITPDFIRSSLIELKAAKLVDWYTAHTKEGDVEVIALPGFKRHQTGARFDREAPSKLPAPDKVRSGPDPDRVSEVKGSEVKLSEDPPNPPQEGGTVAHANGKTRRLGRAARRMLLLHIRDVVAEHGGVDRMTSDKWDVFTADERMLIREMNGLKRVLSAEL